MEAGAGTMEGKAGVVVSIVGTSLVEGAGAHVVYHVVLKCGTHALRLMRRFSEFARSHTRLRASLARASSPEARAAAEQLPRFPPKRPGAGRHMTDPALVPVRVAELQQYWTALLKVPAVLVSPALFDAFGIVADDPAVNKFRQAVHSLGRLLAAGDPGSLGALPRRQGLPQRVLDNDFFYSQRFHLLAAVVAQQEAALPAPPLAPPAVPDAPDAPDAPAAPAASTVPAVLEDVDLRSAAQQRQQQQQQAQQQTVPALFYTHALQFALRRRFWAGDRTIRETPGGRGWFFLAGPLSTASFGPRGPPRMDSLEWFALSNMSGVPLMYIARSRQRPLALCIWEASSDRATGALLYDVRAQATRDYAVLASDACAKNQISCDGSWGEDFSFHQNGDLGPSACATTALLPHSQDTHYGLMVEAHRDVLLFLALSIAIDGLDAEEANATADSHWHSSSPAAK